MHFVMENDTLRKCVLLVCSLYLCFLKVINFWYS